MAYSHDIELTACILKDLEEGLARLEGNVGEMGHSINRDMPIDNYGQ